MHFRELNTDANLLELSHIPLILLAWIHAGIVRARNLIFLEACFNCVRTSLFDFALGMTRHEHGIHVLCALGRAVSDRFATF